VHVAFNYVVRGGQRVRKDTKTHQDRWLAIDPDTCALIATYLDEIRTELAVRHGCSEGMVVSGRSEDMCNKRLYSGEEGIGSFSRETLLSCERGHRRTPAAAEKRPDHFGALGTNTASKVCGPKSCSEGYFKASPYVRYVRVLGPDCGREALQHHSAHLVGERQLALQDLSVEAAQFQRDGDWRAG
jgi:hypothetical protein